MMRANAKKSGTPTESISRGPSSIRPRTKGAGRTQPTEYSEDEVNEEWEDYNQLTEDEKHVRLKVVMQKTCNVVYFDNTTHVCYERGVT